MTYFGYQYANSLNDYGIPLFLPKSEGWILKRKILNSEYFDGMGLYPFFGCNDWLNLEQDFQNLSEEIICLSLVTDPFGKYQKEELLEIFSAVCFPYKEHFVIDLNTDFRKKISQNHLRNIQKSEKKMTVEKIEYQPEIVNDWSEMYENLINRHKIRGLLTFSKKIFKQQLQLENTVIFRAIKEEKIIGMLIFVTDRKVAYYHLGAYSDQGYELGASFALFSQALNYFSNQGFDFIGLGAGAGSENDGNDGLTRFKKGWATGTKTVYFCGKIFNQKIYEKLRALKPEYEKTKYFPAYRLGDFI